MKDLEHEKVARRAFELGEWTITRLELRRHSAVVEAVALGVVTTAMVAAVSRVLEEYCLRDVESASQQLLAEFRREE
jgi:hypothetical protein